MSPLIVFLILSQAPASQDYVGTVPSFSLSAQNTLRDGQLVVKDGRYRARLGDGTCFTMRTYYFRRQDDQAPVLAGTTTCTPSDILRMDQAKRTPQVRLIPAR